MKKMYLCVYEYIYTRTRTHTHTHTHTPFTKGYLSLSFHGLSLPGWPDLTSCLPLQIPLPDSGSRILAALCGSRQRWPVNYGRS